MEEYTLALNMGYIMPKVEINDITYGINFYEVTEEDYDIYDTDE